jgi:c-di-GMP-binding flagellar brake protein YcgR
MDPEKERRKAYRVETKEKPSYEASLILPGGKLLAGDIANISFEGAAVNFPHKQCPPLEQGNPIRLAFRLAHTGDRNWIIHGTVRDSHVNQGMRLLRIRLSLGDTFLQHLQPDDWAIFNRRQTFRVRPNPHSPLTVNLDWEGESTEGQVLDISLGGMGIQLELQVGKMISESQSMTLSLFLPGFDVPLTISGSVCYLRKERDSHRLGITFSSNRDEWFIQKEKAISKFLLMRQREMIGKIEGS